MTTPDTSWILPQEAIGSEVMVALVGELIPSKNQHGNVSANYVTVGGKLLAQKNGMLTIHSESGVKLHIPKCEVKYVAEISGIALASRMPSPPADAPKVTLS